MTFGVYRRISDSGGDGDFYQRVSSPYTAYKIALFDPISSRFNCDNELDIGSEVEVQMGDIVGACIFDPDNNGIFIHSQIDVVGTANGYSLLEMDDISECGADALPSQVLASDLGEQTSRILHVYAEIGTIIIVLYY